MARGPGDRHAQRGSGPRSVFLRVVVGLQGFYYLFTGLWPLLSIDTFLAVTGPKETLWLVRTVGALVLVIGAVLLLAVRPGHLHREVIFLGVASAAAFLVIDVTIVALDLAPAVYLLDALAETLLLIGWTYGILTATDVARRTHTPT